MVKSKCYLYYITDELLVVKQTMVFFMMKQVTGDTRTNVIMRSLNIPRVVSLLTGTTLTKKNTKTEN